MNLFSNNSVFNRFSQAYILRLENCVQAYPNEGSSVFSGLLLTQDEIWAIKQEMVELTKQGRLQSLIANHFKPSGFFRQYADMSDEAMIGFVWEDAANGLNLIIESYLLGKKMSDVHKDGPLYESDDLKYQKKVVQALQKVLDGHKSGSILFYERTLHTALQILELNGRNEAARYEPLTEGENKPATGAIENMDWDNYPYSVLIVPGDSPNSPGDALHISESAKRRIGMAVERYLNGLAPFILFTGANVYPNHTPYHEAIEMKRYAMEQYGIAESAILIDPHARHTTTNIRNASRIIFRYGMPADKKALIVATQAHINVVVSNDFRIRCVREIGYDPIPADPAYSANELDIVPDIRSLHVNPKDFLDP